MDAPVSDGGRYGRMFDLAPLEADEELLRRIGAAGGFCDGGACHDDSSVEAGWPFFGQYVAHDLTADRSPLRRHADLGALRNMRTPRANLESLYGGGPVGSPYMCAREDPAKLLENEDDLPRNQQGYALISDPRNDVHVFMNQMQVAFLRAQPPHRPAARGRLRRLRAVRRSAPRAHLALPLGDRQRVPSGAGRRGDRRRPARL